MTDDEITRYALSARSGDATAVEAFVRATQADVWRFIAYLTDRTLADDLTQETYLRALRGLRSFRGDAHARTWLLTVARRTVVDHFRTKGRPATVPLDTCHDRAGEDHAEALRQLIHGLDPDRRAAFVLTQILGLSYAEAAHACGVPIGTIRSRVARARDDLATRIGRPLADGRRASR